MATKKTTKSEAQRGAIEQEEQTTAKNQAVKGRSFKNEQDELRDKIMNEPREAVFIEKEANEPEGTVEPVIINGVRFNVMKGVYVDVPKTVAKIVRDSQQQTAQAFIDAEQRLKNSEKMEFDNS